jgi:hypothetical protein
MGTASTKSVRLQITMTRLSAVHGLLTLMIGFVCAQSTVIVSIISTTTVHATASDSNACNNFYGACVVYGDNGAPYTTTVYRDSTSAPTEVTKSTTILHTTTVTDAGACSNFAGSCVVYGGENGGAAYTTTATGYQSGQADGQRPLGNSDGYIAQGKSDGSGVIGAASSLAAWDCALISLIVVIIVTVWL